MREQLHWTALGVGVVYCVYDSTFLQLPWWISSQPEGLQLPSRMSVVATGALFCTVPLALLWRHKASDGFRRGIVPSLIASQAIAGLLLASGLWTHSSVFIYAAVFLAYSVGGLTAFATIPWLMTSGYKPALVSSLYLGGSLASLAASVLATFQAPGSASPRFSPQVFFGIITLLVLLLSPVAYYAIVNGNIGISESNSGGQMQLAGHRDDRDQKTSAFERELLPQEQEQLLGATTAATTDNPATIRTLETVGKVGCGSIGDGIGPTQPDGLGCCDRLEKNLQNLDGIKTWGPRAMPLVLLFSVIQACTWLVLRSVIGRTFPSSAE